MIMFFSNRFLASGGLEDHFPHNFMASKDPCPTFLWNPPHRNDASVIPFWARGPGRTILHGGRKACSGRTGADG